MLLDHFDEIESASDAYLLFLTVLATPKFGFGWLVWQRLIGS